MRLALFLTLLALCAASILIGAGGAPTGDDAALLLALRWPRTLAALVAGAALGAAGLLMQAMTANPLAEPGLLGVNAGAALGVVAGITWAGAAAGPGYLLWAFLGAATGSMCVLAIAHARSPGPLRLVLAGLALSATFHGASSAILLGEPAGYDQYRFWVLGSLAGVTPDMVCWSGAPVLLGLAGAWASARPLSALLLGQDSARSLGHRPAALRLGVGAASAVLTASAVALAGPIAFLGLLAPHLARAAATGLPAQLAWSAALGAAVLLVAMLMLGAAGSRGGVAALLVIGIGVASLLRALTELLLSRQELMHASALYSWSVGSLAGRGYEAALPLSLALVVLAPPALLLARRLDVLRLGAGLATSLGAPVRRLQWLALLLAAMLAGLAVGVCGPIAFVALASPFIASRLAGGGRIAAASAAITGALLVVCADSLGRIALSGAELPAGVICNLLGGPFLLWLLLRGSAGESP